MGGRGAAQGAVWRRFPESPEGTVPQTIGRGVRRGTRTAGGADRREGAGDLNNRSGQRSALSPPLSGREPLRALSLQQVSKSDGKREPAG